MRNCYALYVFVRFFGLDVYKALLVVVYFGLRHWPIEAFWLHTCTCNSYIAWSAKQNITLSHEWEIFVTWLWKRVKSTHHWSIASGVPNLNPRLHLSLPPPLQQSKQRRESLGSSLGSEGQHKCMTVNSGVPNKIYSLCISEWFFVSHSIFTIIHNWCWRWPSGRQVALQSHINNRRS